MKTVSVIIPNFNGINLLRENLPILLASLSAGSPHISYEVIVVDDASTDDSAGMISREFPPVKLVRLEKNLGFAEACNAGAKAAEGKILYILNSDIKTSKAFLDPLVPYFESENIFAVSSDEEPDPSPRDRTGDEAGVALVKFKYGLFWYWYEDISKKLYLNSRVKGLEVFCVSGGHTAYSREKYLELGGFDPLFSPFYAEDGDICWRAWKRGWKSLVEPRSVVVHKCQGTIGKLYPRAEIQRIHWKNRFLMMWKNLTSIKLWLEHILFIVPEVIICPFIGKAELSRGFFSALPQIPELLRSRRRDRVTTEAYPDRVLFTKFSGTPHLPPYNILYLHETGGLAGAETSLLNLVANLDRKKFRPIFACPSEGLFAKGLISLGVKLYPIVFPRVRNIIGVWSTLQNVRQIIREDRIRLIHSNSIRTHIYAAFAGKLEKIPVVWHQRNLIDKELVDPDKVLAFIPDAIIGNSRAITARFMRSGRIPGKVHTIYNGVDTTRFNPLVDGSQMRQKFGIAPEEIVVGIASRFNKNKGHEIFLSAASTLLRDPANKDIKIRFLIAGGAVFAEDMAREGYLRDLVRSLGVEERVIFTGFIKEMPDIYAMMDIFVLASDAEPCGRVIFEAMAMGKPIVATNTGGTPEIVPDGSDAILVPARDPDALARAIKTLIWDSDKREAIASAGRNRVEDIFSIEKNVRKTEELYCQLLKI